MRQIQWILTDWQINIGCGNSFFTLISIEQFSTVDYSTRDPSLGINPLIQMSKMKKMAHNFGPVLHRLHDRVSTSFGSFGLKELVSQLVNLKQKLSCIL